MRRRHRHGWVGATFLTAAAWWLSAAVAQTQIISASPVDLSGPVLLDECDSATRSHLERAKAFLDDGQWDEAVETLRQVMENRGDRVIRLTDRRFISVRDYCNLQIVGFYPNRKEALALYRSRVDPVARQWYEAGIATRSADLLRKVVSQAYASSWGDKSLFALGELALEQADYGAARTYWEQLDPTWRAADGRRLWLGLRDGTTTTANIAKPAEAVVGSAAPQPGLKYPDTQLDLADVRARLVLVSILEGSWERTNLELAHFERLHPQAKGRLGGREVQYAAAFKAMINEASKSAAPTPGEDRDWPTFAGSFTRERIVRGPILVRDTAWHPAILLGEPLHADTAVSNLLGFSQRRVAEDQGALLSYHPIVVGNVLLYSNQRQVFAFDLRTGRPAWPGLDAGIGGAGAIYTDQPDAVPENNRPRTALGVPRFTLSSDGNLVYARMGSPITVRQSDSTANDPGALVCLDLATQGGLVRRVTPEEKWAFEGAPVCDGQNVYVVMRYSDVRPQSHVACFDAELGRLRWRRMICASETPAHGQIDEASHNLLTLAGDTLYVNTNMGAVAALSTADGQLKWLYAYPRSKAGDLSRRAAHFYRDLNPCVYYKGLVFVAPADRDEIFALDAATGQELWASDPGDDVVHLLGVGEDRLIASGDQLWWFDVNSGKIAAGPFPSTPDPSLQAFGRGMLAGENVYWPTKTTIEVFSQARGQRQSPIPLSSDSLNLSGGNLIASGPYLVIATPDKIHVLGPKPNAR